MANNIEYVPQNFNDQFEEEKRKFRLSSNDDGWKEAIYAAEEIPCLLGRIKFLLEFSKDTSNKENIENFNRCAENAGSLLVGENHLFEGLLMNDKDSKYPCQLEDVPLSIQIKEKFNITKVEQFTFSNKGRDNRDFGWHRLLNDDPNSYDNPRKDSLAACQNACRTLMLNDSLPNSVKLNTAIDEWKKMLIECPALIKYCSGSILYKVTFKGNNVSFFSFFLSTGKNNQLFSKRNHLSELYTRYLFEKLGDDKKGWEYVGWSYSNDDTPIDTYLKKGNSAIRRKGNYWELSGPIGQCKPDGFPYTALIEAIKGEQ